MSIIDQKLADQVSARLAAEDRAAALAAEAVELREQLRESEEEAGRQRRRAERAEIERDDARDELNNIPAAPGLAAGARRARQMLRSGERR